MSFVNSPPSNAAMTGFEGPEKRLEVSFVPNPRFPSGLRAITQSKWQELLDLAKCTIISATHNSHIDSYVLSESSLFVGATKVVLKTCGTTTLLNCLNKLEEYGLECGSEVEFVLFSRKNFNFPEKQMHPHVNFETEVDILSKKYPTGTAHVMGPVLSGGDHHFVFFSHPLPIPETIDWEDDERTDISEVTLEVLMSELPEEPMSHFIRQPDVPRKTAKETTIDFGLAKLLPNMQSDEVLFDPCGYSLNAINTQEEEELTQSTPGIPNYATVHITPESHCSFVSFETNMKQSGISNASLHRKKLVEDVVALFKPGRFSVVASSYCPQSSHHFFKIPKMTGYSCKFKTHYEYEQGFQVTMMNFVKSTGCGSDIVERRPSMTTPL